MVGEEEAAFERGTGAEVVEGGCRRTNEFTVGTYEVVPRPESDLFAVVMEGLRENKLQDQISKSDKPVVL